jgi:tRNA (guanosine-2'-O-)-methyltransferase
MRRNSPGVLGPHELADPSIARAEAFSVERVVRTLEPLVTEARRSRLKEVIGRRLASVTVVLDGPYDPHNGAAVVRSCEAFGLQAMHVALRASLPFVVARSVARGSQKWIDVTCHERASSLLAAMKQSSLTLVAADAEGDLVPEDLGSVPRLALVVGNEREGIREEIARACRWRVRVPMRGHAESLNVSVTTAILLDAATRNRAGDLDDPTRLRLYARGLVLSVPRALELLDASPSEASEDRRR